MYQVNASFHRLVPRGFGGYSRRGLQKRSETGIGPGRIKAWVALQQECRQAFVNGNPECTDRAFVLAQQIVGETGHRQRIDIERLVTNQARQRTACEPD